MNDFLLENFCEGMSDNIEQSHSHHMQVFIKDNKTYTIDCNRSDTILSAKLNFSAKAHCSVYHMTWVYGSKHLHNDMTFADYNIHGESTIFHHINMNYSENCPCDCCQYQNIPSCQDMKS